MYRPEESGLHSDILIVYNQSIHSKVNSLPCILYCEQSTVYILYFTVSNWKCIVNKVHFTATLHTELSIKYSDQYTVFPAPLVIIGQLSVSRWFMIYATCFKSTMATN